MDCVVQQQRQVAALCLQQASAILGGEYGDLAAPQIRTMDDRNHAQAGRVQAQRLLPMIIPRKRLRAGFPQLLARSQIHRDNSLRGPLVHGFFLDRGV